ncbi:MAG: hypothetical protein AB8F94_21970 [Saprospiraceae bacterium]
MKNLTKIFFILSCLLPVFSFGQDCKWLISFKTNVIHLDIENDIFIQDGGFIAAGINKLDYNIYRKSTPLFGWNFGMNRKFKVMDDFYLLTGFDLRFSQFGIQEWLGTSGYADSYNPIYEMPEIVLDGKINREKLDRESYPSVFNPFPKNEPNKLKKNHFTFLDIPLNIHFESPSKKWLASAGFAIGISLESMFRQPYTFSHKNIFFGANANFSYKIYSNWYLSLSYIGFHEELITSQNDSFKSNDQNIISLGFTCLIRP